MEPLETTSEANRLASFLRRMWPAGSAARLRLTELPTCGIALLSLETRHPSENWIRRVQLQVDHALIAPVADDLGIEVRVDAFRPPRPVGPIREIVTLGSFPP